MRLRSRGASMNSVTAGVVGGRGGRAESRVTSPFAVRSIQRVPSMTRLRLSLLITFFASNGATAVTFLVSLILARLLSPSEIGIFSMTAVLVGIAGTFRDFGVSSYLLQEKTLTPEKIRSASGVLIASSWLLGCAMFALSPTVANYLRQPATREVMQVLAAGFFFIPFGAITHTLLARDYRAREQALVYIAGTLAYATSALWLAANGHSYMSMAWANLVNILATAGAYAFFRPHDAPWMPSFSGWKRVASFGGGAIAGNAMGQINNALPDMWLGKTSGAHDVGLFSRANGTANIFMQIAGPTINYAALPHLAQQHHRGEELRPTLCKAAAYLSVCGWPPLVLTAIYPTEVVQFLYGLKWLDCAPSVRLLCICLCIAIPFHFQGVALQAVGRPFLAIAPQAGLLFARVACVMVVYDGSLNSFGWALLIAAILATPVNQMIQSRFFGLGVREFTTALMPSFAVAAACGAAAAALHALTPAGWPAFAKLGVLVLAVAPIWFLTVVLIRHPFSSELERIGERVPAMARLLRFLTRTA